MKIFDNDELRRRVDEVLYYIWDPIGVSDQPYARAEYEGYVPNVLQLVTDNVAIEPISAYSADIIKTRVELTPNKQDCDDVATLLLQHKSAIKDGCA